MSNGCRYGFSVPTRGPLAKPESVITLAHRGEELGFTIIAVSDHIVKPQNVTSLYPSSDTGKYVGNRSGECLEQLTLLSFLASQTVTARLLTSVTVLPYRNPVLTAKILASIDVLCKGRLNVGCGVGWMREEFEAIGAPPFGDRGAVSDEYIRVFKELWTSDNPRFEGKYCRFSNITFIPKPLQKPHPPLWIGGKSPAALRRVVRFGDAWYPISTTRSPLDTVEQFSDSLTRLRRYAEGVGRSLSEIELAFATESYDEHEAQLLPNGVRRAFTGTPSQIAEDIRRFKQLGLRHLIIDFQSSTLGETLRRMERFATSVMPLADR